MLSNKYVLILAIVEIWGGPKMKMKICGCWCEKALFFTHQSETHHEKPHNNQQETKIDGTMTNGYGSKQQQQSASTKGPRAQGKHEKQVIADDDDDI